MEFEMLNQLKNPLDLVSRILIALLFLPAGIQKNQWLCRHCGLCHIGGHAHAADCGGRGAGD